MSLIKYVIILLINMYCVIINMIEHMFSNVFISVINQKRSTRNLCKILMKFKSIWLLTLLCVFVWLICVIKFDLVVFSQKSAWLMTTIQILMLVTNIISKLYRRFDLIIVGNNYHVIIPNWLKFQLPTETCRKSIILYDQIWTDFPCVLCKIKRQQCEKL